MPAGRRDFERAAREQLTADVGEIGAECGQVGRVGQVAVRRALDGSARSARAPPRRATTPRAPPGRRQSPPRWRSPPAAACRPCPSRRAATAIGSTPRVAWTDPSSDSSPSSTRSAICRRSTTPGRREDAERDRQIERGAGLAHVGRRQVDGDPVRRKLEAGVANRDLHTLAALADARVRQADHRERRQAERDVDLDVNRAGLHAEDRGRPQAGQHGSAAMQTRLPQTATCISTT